MKRRAFLLGTPAALLLASGAAVRAEEGLVVVANASLRALDAESLRRIYTGRMIEVDGQPVFPAQLAPGQPLRQRFLGSVLQQRDEDYVAYWTVRRYIGKGTPPRELATPADMVAHVQRTPGAIGYCEVADLKPGMTVLLRR